jgi:hypothetical protein
MERIIRFVALIVLMEVAAALAIKLAGGQPFSSMSGWRGIGALALLLAGTAIIAGGLWALGRGNFDNEVLILLVAVGTACILGLGFVGLKWLMGPLESLLEGGGIWWPIVVLLACLVAWFAKLSRH